MTSPSDRPEGAGVRLHPMTLAHRAVVSIPALVVILLPVLRSGDSTAWFNLVIAILYGAVVLPWMIVHYLRFRYWITQAEIVIHSGVLTRRRRNIPIDRIQTVDIERQLLHRASGTARVRIHTAGSTRAEGSLDVVSLAEAERIRATVRALQQGEVPAVAEPAPLAETEADAFSEARSEPPVADVPDPLVFSMSPSRVLLSGVFRFSLLYLAVAFSVLQYVEPNPEVFLNVVGRILGDAALQESPITTAIAATIGAVLLGWASGIAMNVNRYWGFRLERADGRLYRRHGLLSIREGAIPLKRVQSLVVRTNPIKRRFGWYRLEVQTMGIDVGEAGHAIVVPFANHDDIERVASLIMDGMNVHNRGEVQVPADFLPVSPLTIRRAFVRYSVGLGVLTAVTLQFWSAGWWLLALVPFALVAAVLRFRHMGYLATDSRLWVRSGVLRQYVFLIPLSRLQVVYQQASLFQRRLRLASIYTDTAGASPVRGADIVDLPRQEAEDIATYLYGRFKRLTSG